MSKGGGAARAPVPYKLEPPPWRPALHHSDASLGTPGLRMLRGTPPPSDYALQHGAPLPPLVPSETASMQAHILDRVAGPAALQLLGDLFQCVRDKRRNGASLADAPTPLPPRVTLNDAKRSEYVRQLADPHVPLYQLAERIPHGFRGVRLLDMLLHGALPGTPPTRSVPLSRALWLIRMIGALELDGPQKDVHKYTSDWTVRVLHWLSQLVASLREPTTWAAQWGYATALVDRMVQESLIEPYMLYRWIVTQLAQTHAGVRACFLQWAVLHSPAILGHAALGTALLAALGELAAEASWLGQQAGLHFAACVQAAPLLSTALPPSVLAAQGAPERLQRQAQLLQVALSPLLSGSCDTGDAVAVSLLDRAASTTTLFADYFLPRHASAAVAQHRLFLLFYWACTEARQGHHRIFVAAALVQLLDECQAQRLTLPDGRYLPCPWTPFSLGDAMLQWIDSLDESGPDHHLHVAMAARLLGVLAQKELFSYAALLQRLMARGSVRATSELKTARHSATVPIRLLRKIPVPQASTSLQQQRRFTIYGARTSESYEEATERRAVRELRRLFEWDEALPSCASSPKLPTAPLGVLSPPSVATAMWTHPAATTDLLQAFQLQQRLPHLWSASPYIQARIVDRFLLPALLSDVSGIQPNRFALAATLLTSLHAMEALAKLMCALLDGHNLMCVVSICHTIAAHARVWDALDKTSALADLISPYALADAPLLPGMTRVVPATGRGMTLALARHALAALSDLDESVLRYAPLPQAPLPSALSPASLAREAVHVLLMPGAAWDDACTALIAAVPLAEAASLLCTQALDLLADGHLASDALLTCVASLAGTAGVCLDHVAHTWVRSAWERQVAETAWTTLLLSLIRFGYVDGDRLVQEVLCPFFRTASSTHVGWRACITLLHALVFTYTAPASPCSLEALGYACWYDVTLVRAGLGLSDGFVPLLHALDTCQAPHTDYTHLLETARPQLRTLWLGHPDAVWHGFQALDPQHRAGAHRAMRAVLEESGSAHTNAWPLRLDDVFEGALAALDVRVRWDLSTEPPATGDTPMELLLRWDLPPAIVAPFTTMLLTELVECDRPGPTIEALARFVQAWTGELIPCDADAAARAVAALPAVARRVTRNEWLSAILSVLRCTTTAGAWVDVLHLLVQHTGPWVAAVAVRVQSALPAAAVDAWLYQCSPLGGAGSSAWLTRYDRARTSPSPWTQLDATEPPASPSRDPWARPLLDRTGLLSDMHAQKTRETMPSIQHGVPPWLVSEQSYGDGDDAQSRYAAVFPLTKRRRSSASPSPKRARH
ncbi:RNA polymerase II mediator complex subunit [Malassezia caprae]|uniref:Mediator of RNA polymerase II transcription subunit 12 n=1 Tax=Malassezia caprae TaxID=1381934 RepID=A0AAF0E4H0_9BASI|nr:RNA polymerase II mediator complex subunit [Malassezia caprae]